MQKIVLFGSRGCGKHLLAELWVLFQAFKCLFGGDLVGFFFAVAHGLAGKESTHNDGCAEHGTVVVVGGNIHQFVVD